MATVYLTMQDIVAIHSEQISAFGGTPGIRDKGLIEAALQRPQSGYYSDIVEEAAAMWESLTMNHGFVDGNKRVGFMATYVFLRMNGVLLDISSEQGETFILGSLEAGIFNKDSLASWLREHTRVA